MAVTTAGLPESGRTPGAKRGVIPDGNLEQNRLNDVERIVDGRHKHPRTPVKDIKDHYIKGGAERGRR